MTHTEETNWNIVVSQFNKSWSYTGCRAIVLTPSGSISPITIQEQIYCTNHSLYIKRNNKEFKILRIVKDRKLAYERDFRNFGESQLYHTAFCQ